MDIRDDPPKHEGSDEERGIDAFPLESPRWQGEASGEYRLLQFEDADVTDRARADDAGPAVAALPVRHHRRRRERQAQVWVAGLAVAAAVGWGAFLYLWTRPLPRVDAGRTTSAAQTMPVPGPAASSASPDSSAELAAALSPTSTARPSPSTTGAASKVPDARTSRRPQLRSSGGDAQRAVARSAAPAAPVSRAAATASGTTAPPLELSGAWLVTARSEGGGNATSGYYLQLEQRGQRLSGVIRKLTHNSAAVDETAQTAVPIRGQIEGQRVTLTFAEGRGAEAAAGKLVLVADDEGLLRGRFTDAAARAGGTVEARRP